MPVCLFFYHPCCATNAQLRAISQTDLTIIATRSFVQDVKQYLVFLLGILLKDPLCMALAELRARDGVSLSNDTYDEVRC